MATTRKLLVAWLNDAYGMEKNAEEMLEKQAKRLGDFPTMQQKVREHLETTRIQCDRVEGCLRSLDEKPSTLKSAAGKISANLGAMANATAEDEVIKNGIADFAFENFEIASYESLVAAAELLGEQQIAQACRQNLEEEREMAQWLQQHLPETTQQFLSAHAPA